MADQFDKLCTTCRHSTPAAAGPSCLLWRSPVNGSPMLCSGHRIGASGCGAAGNLWEPRLDLDVATGAILADPATSYWLKAAATAVIRDPVDVLADAEALVMALKARCDTAFNDSAR